MVYVRFLARFLAVPRRFPIVRIAASIAPSLATLALLGLVVSVSSPAQARQATEFPQSSSTEFARVVHDDDGQPLSLQIAIARYQPATGEAAYSVDLIGAVHVGDAGYYAELNQRFRDYDSVLFELIAPPGSEERIGTAERKGMISGVQLQMTRALGLKFQLDEIDYRQPNLVHADLTPTELAESMAERDESLYVYFWRLFYASVRQASNDPLGLRAWQSMGAAFDSDVDNPLKLAFAYEMTNVRGLGTALDGFEGSALIAARNERAVDVLKERLDAGDRKLAIFYGVAHMPDFERRLDDVLGLQYHDTRWVHAWRLAPPDRVDPPGRQ